MKIIRFFDTTLRDGEQAPGNTMDVKQKVKIAKALEDLGVDTIEAGFPISSMIDYEAVKRISRNIRKSSVCAFARCRKEDIDVATESIKHAKKPRLHIFIATSDVHMKYKLGMNQKEVVESISSSISYAKKFVSEITFAPEDSTRSDKNFLFKCIDSALKSGATSITLADTTGYSTPQSFGKLVKDVKENLNRKTPISVHCHNDLGLSTANTLAGIENGAEEVQVTVNGIGERAGNTSLEEVALALHIRKDLYGCETNIKLNKLYKTSKMIYDIIGRQPSHEKPIVGINAFRHEAGIHQDGMKKNPNTYEIIDPRIVGRKREYVYDRHSGKKFAKRLGIKKYFYKK